MEVATINKKKKKIENITVYASEKCMQSRNADYA